MPDLDVQARRIIVRTARHLPHAQRSVYQAAWLAELQMIPTPAERLAYAQGLKRGLPSLQRELDPQMAAIRTIIQSCGALALGTQVLGTLGVFSTVMPLVSSTALAGMTAILFTFVATQCVLWLPEVRRSWWRVLGLLFWGGVATLVSLFDVAWWSTFHPETFLVLLACTLLGVERAKTLHVARPPLPRR